MTRLEIEWPDQNVERVRAAVGRLEVAGEQLRSWDFERRLEVVQQTLREWLAPDSAWRARARSFTRCGNAL